MAGEWQTTTLGATTDFLSGGTPSKEQPTYWGGHIPWVSAKDMKRFRLNDTEDHLTENGAASGTRIAPSGSVLLLTRGMTLLHDIPICVTQQAMAFNQDVKALRPKTGTCAEFLPYLLLGQKERLLAAVDLAGHGTGRLNSDELKSLPVLLPSSDEQRAIAHVLGALDDKIEVNRRMNETLEGMARALFQSWFVDFDPVRAKAEGRDPGLPPPLAALFPDSFEESVLGLIPKGWTCTTLGSLCRRVAMGPFGSDIKTDNFVSAGVPIIRGSNLKDGFSEENFVFVSESKADELRNANAHPGDVVVTHRGTLGQVGIIPDVSQYPRYVVSQSQLLLTVDPGTSLPYYVYMYLRSAAGQHALLANTSQTGVPAIARPTVSVKGIPIINPSMPVLREFDSVLKSFLCRINSNRLQSKTLASLRDTLLPKLISGELRIADADRFLEKVSA